MFSHEFHEDLSPDFNVKLFTSEFRADAPIFHVNFLSMNFLFKRHHFRHYKNENANFRIDTVIMNNTQVYNVYGNYISTNIFSYFLFYSITYYLFSSPNQCI